MKPNEIAKKLNIELKQASSLLQLMKYDSPNTYALDEKGQITGLNLRSLQLSDDQIDFLWNLATLQALNLSENNLRSVHIPEVWDGLKYLNLSENKKLQMLRFAGGLPHLEKLDLTECALEEIRFPAGFADLDTLYLQKNKLSQVGFEGDCPNLKLLDLSENQLPDLVLPGGFGRLAYLFLNDNKLERLVFTAPLPRLETLHLRNNQLQELPKGLLQFSALKALYLYNNPLPDIPKEAIAPEERKSSLESIRNYFLSLRKSQKVPLRQAKMILVGNGEVGKTSIRLKLINRKAKLPKPEERTAGLDVAPYTLKALPPEITRLNSPIDFQLNVWDFGGQGKYREVQQLFCSRKSLYLFVTAYDDTRDKEDYIGFDYWLSMVNAYSYDEAADNPSPVIYVVNKIDEQVALVNEQKMCGIFPNIHPEFVKISCKTLKNFDQLENAIRSILWKVSSDIFSAQFAAYWLNAKEELEKIKNRNHISYGEYLAICRRQNMEAGEAKTWIEILDRIGAVIYFGDHPGLKDWVILNPAWVKDALFKVLDYPSAAGGRLRPTDLPFIWPDYTEKELQNLVKLMLEYKLCYAQENQFGETEYMVPALFREKAPHLPHHLQRTPDYQLKFAYSPFIPAGTVNKLIVHLKESPHWLISEPRAASRKDQGPSSSMPMAEIYGDLMWKNNLFLHDPENNTYARVSEDWEDKTVYLDLYGEQPRPIFEGISSMLRQINRNIKDTKYISRLDSKAWVWYKKKWRALEDVQDLGIDFFASPKVPSKEQQLIDQVEELISQGRLKEALRYLKANTPTQLHVEIVELKSRLSTLERNDRMGVLNFEQASVERNRIRSAVLALAGQME